MASDTLIDLEGLLTPISEESPTGEDARQKPSYLTVASARNSARSAERSHAFDGINNEANEFWKQILDTAPGIIQHESKDLKIASWYCEALIRLHGFQGLRDGFQLLHGLVENFWEGLFPLPDEDGMEIRVASLTGLNGEGSEGAIIAPIRNVIITQGREPGPFSFWQYRQALEVERLPDEDARQKKIANIGFSLKNIEQAVTESTEAFFVDVRDDVQACIDLYSKLSELLDSLCESHISPSSSNILNTLKEVLGAINHIGKNKFPVTVNDEPETTEATDADTSHSEQTTSFASAVPAGSIKNREAAFRQLADIAEFFRRTEPHSPISYVLEKAVKWGDMPLSALIAELIPDESSREHYSKLTGVGIRDNDQ